MILGGAVIGAVIGGGGEAMYEMDQNAKQRQLDYEALVSSKEASYKK
jgi:hypothetical protein